MTPAERKRAIQSNIESLEDSARCFEQGGYPPNPAKAAPISAARCRARADELRARLGAL